MPPVASSVPAPPSVLGTGISVAPNGSVAVPDEIDGSELGGCVRLALAYEAAMGDIRALAGGGTKADFDRVRMAFDTLESTLPTELREPFRTIHEAVLAFARKAESLSLATSEGLLQLSEAAQAFDNEAVTAAGDKIDAYFTTRCAEPDPADVGPVGPVGTPPPGPAAGVGGAGR